MCRVRYLLRLGFVVIVLITAQTSFAQIPDSVLKKIPMPELGPNDTIPVPAALYGGTEIIPSQNLEWFYVTGRWPKHLAEKRKEWTRLRNAVYVTYPYARKAGMIMVGTRLILTAISLFDSRYFDKKSGFFAMIILLRINRLERSFQPI